MCARTANSRVKEEDRVMGSRVGVVRFGAMKTGKAQMPSGA